MAHGTRGMNWGRRATILVPYLWLLCFFLAPFLIVLKISISEPAIARPPYVPVWDSPGDAIQHLADPPLDNYEFVRPSIGCLEGTLVGRLVEAVAELPPPETDCLYTDSYLTSVGIAAVSTLIALAIGYPMAYGIARAAPAWRGLLLTLVILPFWTSFLIRVYAWIGILKPEGLLNGFLLWLGLIDQPLNIYLTPTAVHIGIVYSYLPFMIMPLYASLEKLDQSLLEAAADLGARPLTAFWRVTLPLSLPGIVAGCFLVFIPAVGEFVIPELLGGSSTQTIGRTLWAEFFQNRDWPLASAVAILLLLILVVPIMIFERFAKREGAG
jgi:putrescine transport system permease protein